MNTNTNTNSEISNVVHKWNLNPKGTTECDMPAQAQILAVELGSQGIKVFALVKNDPDQGTDLRKFLVVQTGQPLPTCAKAWHGTATLPGAPAFHVFEVPLNFQG